MPRVHFVKKAQKDNPVVKAGEPYYWWKFRYGGKRYSKTPPRSSQLTQSKWGQVWEAQEGGEDMLANLDLTMDMEEFESEIESIMSDAASDVRMVGEEYQQSADNIREHFPDSEQADQCEEKAQHLENLADEIESIEWDATNFENSETPTHDELEAERDRIAEEFLGLNWDTPC